MSDAARVKAKEVLQQYVEALGAMGNALLPEWSKCRNGLLDRIAGALDAFAAERESATWKAAVALVPKHCARCLHDSCEALRRVARILRSQIES